MSVDFRRYALRKFVVQCRIPLQLVNGKVNFRREDHVAVLLLQLMDVVGVKISVSEEASSNGLKTFVRNRKEYSSQMDDISRTHCACEASCNVYGHRARDVADRDLVRLLLVRTAK